MVRIRYRGRLGNRLFQYAYARIAAEALDLELPPHLIQGFSATASAVAGRTIDSSKWYVPGEHEAPESLPKDRAISVQRYHQHWEFMHRSKEQIRRWFALTPWPDLVHPDDVLVAVRLGDYLKVKNESFRRAIPTYESFYAPLFDQMNPRRIFLTSDQPQHPYIMSQFRGVEHVMMSPIDTLRFMGSFRRLIISQSTFAWWGAFLSNRAEEIQLAMPERSLWRNNLSAITPCQLPGWNWVKCQSIVDMRENWVYAEG